MQVKIGDVVVRKSYNLDLLFRVIDVISSASGEQIAILHGDEVRLIADADCSDLVLVDEAERNSRKQRKERIDQSYHLFRQDYQLLRKSRSTMQHPAIATMKSFSICRGESCMLMEIHFIYKSAWLYMRRLVYRLMVFTLMKKRCRKKSQSSYQNIDLIY